MRRTYDHQFGCGARDLHGGVPVVCGGVYAVQHEYLRARTRAGDHQGAGLPPWRGVHHYVNKETLILTAIGAALGVPLGGFGGRELYLHFADAVAVF